MSHKKEQIEKLILLVKNHPIMYDMTLPDFKNVRQKDYIWDNIISPEMNGEKGESLKAKWKNLRDSYQKHLKANTTTTGQAANASKGKQLDMYRNYVWAKHLEFLQPHVKFATTMSNVQQDRNTNTDENFDGASEEDVGECNSEVISPPRSTYQMKKNQGREKDNEKNVSNIDKVLEHLNKKQRVTSSAMDAVELLMMSHTKTIKTFSLKRQANAKKIISSIIGDLEIEQIEENENRQLEKQTFTYGQQNIENQQNEQQTIGYAQQENEYHDLHLLTPSGSALPDYYSSHTVMNLSKDTPTYTNLE